ncbi:hypothetical protein AKJ16_DCAP22002, partial [Drosera capensis]
WYFISGPIYRFTPLSFHFQKEIVVSVTSNPSFLFISLLYSSQHQRTSSRRITSTDSVIRSRHRLDPILDLKFPGLDVRFRRILYQAGAQGSCIPAQRIRVCICKLVAIYLSISDLKLVSTTREVCLIIWLSWWGKLEDLVRRSTIFLSGFSLENSNSSLRWLLL